jgi:hypothetical protein
VFRLTRFPPFPYDEGFGGLGDITMRIAYLDCFSGISGDMFLGALVAAGVPLALLQETVSALDIGASLEVSSVLRSGIGAVKLDVLVDGEKDRPCEDLKDSVARPQNPLPNPVHAHEHPHQHEHEHQQHEQAHDHEHSHDHGHDIPAGEHSHAHAHPHAHQHGRSLARIRSIIADAPLGAAAKSTAAQIFAALGSVEASIHQVEIENIHFHEVGSTDALVDIIGAAVGAEALGVDQWVCSPLNVGSGTVECAHGRFPIPAPATLELLRRCRAPIYSSGIERELVTPTGAAIVSVLAQRFGAMPAMSVERVGYGAGFRDLPRHPNVVRLTIGEASEAVVPSTDVSGSDSVTVLETNLDDVAPQVVGYVLERALAAGALDVFTTPVQMKKSRPGMLLTLLCRPEDADGMAALLFAETTTLGVRRRQEERQCLARRHATVQTPWGEVRVKLGSRGDQLLNCAPEYEDCRRIASEQHIPLKTVMREAVRLYMENHHE